MSTEQKIIAFLEKYQEFRRQRVAYGKNPDRFTLGKYLKLELELDKEAEELKAALQQP